MGTGGIEKHLGKRAPKWAALALALTSAACAGTPPPRAALTQPYATSDAPYMEEPLQPQSCAIYAREHSAVEIWGDAYTWWDQATGRYAQESMPRQGSVMVLTGYAGPKHGHVAVITRVVSPREIRVDHANWLNDGNIYKNTPVIDVSPGNDWTEVRVWNTRDGHLGGGVYRVRGFISSDPAPPPAYAALEPGT